MMWAQIGSISMAVAIALAAFAKHSLQSRLEANAMEAFKGAALYMMIHSLGLILISCLQKLNPQISLTPVAITMSLGMLFFCGSLFAYSLTGIRALGAITPIGGICFIAAWIILAIRLKGMQ